MCPEECEEFLLKRKLAVVSFLFRNVTPHRFHLRFAHREGTISVLPAEPSEFGEGIVNPTRRVRLDRSQNIRHCLVLAKASQKMDMVRDAIGDQTEATFAANGTAKVFPQPRA